MSEDLNVSKGHRRSVSQLQSYAKCGWEYYLSRKLKVPQRQATWFVQGTAVHAAAEAYERSGRQMSLAEAHAVFEAAWEVETAEAESLQPDPKMWMVGGRKTRETDAEQRWNLGHVQVEEYIVHHPKEYSCWAPLELAPGQPAVEVEFEITFGDVLVVGAIDSISVDPDGHIAVVDIKTGTKKPFDPYQMVTYKFAVQELFDIHVDIAQWWMCKDSAYEVMENLHNFSFDEMVEWYAKLDYGIQNETFLANPTDGCFTCTVKPYCKYENQYAMSIEPFIQAAS